MAVGYKGFGSDGAPCIQLGTNTIKYYKAPHVRKRMRLAWAGTGGVGHVRSPHVVAPSESPQLQTARAREATANAEEAPEMQKSGHAPRGRAKFFRALRGARAV